MARPKFIEALEAAAKASGYQTWKHSDGVIVGPDRHNLLIGHWAKLGECAYIGEATPESILELIHYVKVLERAFDNRVRITDGSNNFESQRAHYLHAAEYELAMTQKGELSATK